jgi:hypothetical protein
MSYILTPDIYERVFAVAHNEIFKVFAHPEKCCTLFAVIGSAILNKFHNINAAPYSGIAAFNLGLSKVLAFAEQTNAGPVASEKGFHSWVEVDGWFIDFTSPLFPEMAASMNLGRCQRRMFQKKLSEASCSIYELNSIASFYCQPDKDFSSKRIDVTFDTQKTVDVVYQSINSYARFDKITNPVLRIEGAW